MTPDTETNPRTENRDRDLPRSFRFVPQIAVLTVGGIVAATMTHLAPLPVFDALKGSQMAVVGIVYLFVVALVVFTRPVLSELTPLRGSLLAVCCLAVGVGATLLYLVQTTEISQTVCGGWSSTVVDRRKRASAPAPPADTAGARGRVTPDRQQLRRELNAAVRRGDSTAAFLLVQVLRRPNGEGALRRLDSLVEYRRRRADSLLTHEIRRALADADRTDPLQRAGVRWRIDSLLRLDSLRASGDVMFGLSAEEIDDRLLDDALRGLSRARSETGSPDIAGFEALAPWRTDSYDRRDTETLRRLVVGCRGEGGDAFTYRAASLEDVREAGGYLLLLLYAGIVLPYYLFIAILGVFGQREA